MATRHINGRSTQVAVRLPQAMYEELLGRGRPSGQVVSALTLWLRLSPQAAEAFLARIERED